MWAGLCVKGGGEGSSDMGRVDKVQRTGVLGLDLATDRFNMGMGQMSGNEALNCLPQDFVSDTEEKEAQRRGAMSFLGGLYLKVKEVIWKGNL